MVSKSRLLEFVPTTFGLPAVELHHKYVLEVEPFTGLDVIQVARTELEVLGKVTSSAREDGVLLYKRVSEV